MSETLEEQNHRLRLALADAILRPMGVVPDSARGLVSSHDLEAAERRRAYLPDKAEVYRRLIERNAQQLAAMPKKWLGDRG
jgi:hypothetical protein